MTDDTQTGQVHLVLGPVGAGKTTWARAQADELGAAFFDLDDWMARLFRPDRPDTGDRVAWYVVRAQRCVEQIWDVALEVTACGTPVMLELGLVRRAEREAFYRRIEADERSLRITLLDAPRDERRARVLDRNEAQGDTFSMVVPPDVFELASDLWEPPDEVERDRMGIRTLSSA